MAYTVPQFDPYIYLFAKQKNNEEGKGDISSWRGNVVEKKRRMIMKRFLLEQPPKLLGFAKSFPFSNANTQTRFF